MFNYLLLLFNLTSKTLLLSLLFRIFIIYMFALASIITALLVITSNSTVYSVLWLVATFLIVSAYLGFLNLGFTALLYVIVYVGAIAILFLFVVQLLDLGSQSQQPNSYINNNTKLSNSITPLAIIISTAYLSILIAVYLDLNLHHIIPSLHTLLYKGLDVNSLFSAKIIVENSTLLFPASSVTSIQGDTPQVQSIASWFYGPGLLPLIIISIILLVAMIAPILLCKDND